MDLGEMQMKLRFLEEKDAPLMLEWMHDPEVNRWFRFHAADRTLDDVKQFITDAQADTKKNRHYAICGDDDVYLGTISLKNIDYVNKNAECAVAMRRSAFGSGAAAWAMKTVVRLAFDELELIKVYVNILSDNKRSLAYCKKTGFIFEGEFKQHLIIDGKVKGLCWLAQYKTEENNG